MGVLLEHLLRFADPGSMKLVNNSTNRTIIIIARKTYHTNFQLMESILFYPFSNIFSFIPKNNLFLYHILKKYTVD